MGSYASALKHKSRLPCYASLNVYIYVQFHLGTMRICFGVLFCITDNVTGAAGTLPANWSTLPQLTDLRISNAPKIIGSLPPEWASNLRLQRLELRNMSLAGPLPPLSNMTTLTSLTLRHLQNATLPAGGIAALAGNASLAELVLGDVSGWSGMPLEANLTDMYPNISRLGLLQLGLVGEIPTSWQNLRPQQLKDLYLSHNSLNGTLPSWLASRVGQGYTLDLSYNNFTGGTQLLSGVLCASRSPACIRALPSEKYSCMHEQVRVDQGDKSVGRDDRPGMTRFGGCDICATACAYERRCSPA